MAKFEIAPYSDDIIGYDYKDQSDSMDSGCAYFTITFPNGEDLEIKIRYSNGGWGFTMDLPEGTKLSVRES